MGVFKRRIRVLIVDGLAMAPKTIEQNSETCVVYGMPKAVFDMGVIEEVFP